jgi:RNA polymerase sigma factor (sigma-70 family)
VAPPDPLADEIAALAGLGELDDTIAAGCGALRRLAGGYEQATVLDLLATLRVSFEELEGGADEVVGHQVTSSYAADVALARAAMGDEAARVTLVEIVVPISAAVIRRFRVALHRDDLMQDHVLLVLSKIGLYGGRSSLRTWISRVCENHVRNFVTRRLPDAVVPIKDFSTCDLPDPTGRTPWEDVMERWRHERLYRALCQLPEEQWDAVVLRFFADLSYERIADRLGIPVGTAKSRVARGVGRLGRELRQRGMDDADT